MKDKKDFSKWLPLAFIVAGLAVFLASHENDQGTQKIRQTAKTQERVNAYLAQTTERLEMERKRMQIENARLSMDYQQTKAESAYTVPKEGAELKSDSRSEGVAQDLGLDEMKRASSNPMDMIHHQLFEEQKMKQMDDAYKREYARQFIENARRGGYEIKLNDEFKVISVKPLRKPTNNYHLFNEN